MPDFEYYRHKLKERGIITSGQPCERLLEEAGISLLPGFAFGFLPEKLVSRLSYVDFEGAKVLA